MRVVVLEEEGGCKRFARRGKLLDLNLCMFSFASANKGS